MKKIILGGSLITGICLAVIFCIAVGTHKSFMQEKSNPKPKILNNEVTKLLEVVKDKNLVTENPEKLAQAIEELGQRRVLEAVPDLIQLLFFRKIHKWEDTGFVLHPLPEEGDYPAVGSLFSIGESALPSLIKVIEENDGDSIESKNALRVIHLIFRDDLSKAVDYLENATHNSSNQKAKQCLSHATEKTRMKLNQQNNKDGKPH